MTKLNGKLRNMGLRTLKEKSFSNKMFKRNVNIAGE